MYLFHYTYSENIEKIREEGLKVGEKLFETEIFGDEIEKYKPVHFPQYVNFHKAIFFNPTKRKDSEEPFIIVDSKSLNQEKIYIADKKVIGQLWHEIINVYYGANTSGISVETLAHKFWNKLVNIEEYEKVEKKYKRIEILYFDEIGKEKIIIG